MKPKQILYDLLKRSVLQILSYVLILIIISVIFPILLPGIIAFLKYIFSLSNLYLQVIFVILFAILPIVIAFGLIFLSRFIANHFIKVKKEKQYFSNIHNVVRYWGRVILIIIGIIIGLVFFPSLVELYELVPSDGEDLIVIISWFYYFYLIFSVENLILTIFYTSGTMLIDFVFYEITKRKELLLTI
ncbi:MAG: hypothetical protein GF317_25040 [Candidatus Lokiarchaeota archaeon]|nr:hypothetical protein [Candidatus Lokiarchaeota archaeon]